MRQEIGKWNQRTPRRFQTGRWHQTSQASIRGKQHLNEQTKLSDTLHNIEVLRCHVNETVRFHKNLKMEYCQLFMLRKCDTLTVMSSSLAPRDTMVLTSRLSTSRHRSTTVSGRGSWVSNNPLLTLNDCTRHHHHYCTVAAYQYPPLKSHMQYILQMN